MHILSVSLNYRNTPVQLREKFAISEESLPKALTTLRHSNSVLECVILATCNRTEIYAVVDQLHTGRHFIKNYLADWFSIHRDEFIHHLDIKEDDQAIEHLFQVSTGLDSMVLGETQILGQMKGAFQVAQETSTTGTIFNMLFKQVITLAKRAHAETEIGQHAVSISYAAIELAKKLYGDLRNKSVLIVGAGKMSELTVKHLYANGVAEVLVVNRTLERAQELATKFSGQAFDFSGLHDCLKKVDIVISSTGSKDFVITKEMIQKATKDRFGNPLFLIDIAVPRDLDPRIQDLDNAYLYDIDDLNGIVEANLADRQKEALKIRSLIEVELDEFKKWMTTLGVVPIISALREKALVIQEETMQSIQNKCPDLDERELKVLRKHTKSIVNQLLKDPISRIKEMAAESNSKEQIELFTKIFALENEVVDLEMSRKQQVVVNSENSKQPFKDRPTGKELPIH
jgi:glutamyl-tRNA reductase